MSEYILTVLLGRSRIRHAILAMLFLWPERRLHLREIARRAGTSAGTAAREIARLESAGLLRRTAEGRQVYFEVNRSSPLTRSVTELVRRTMGTASVLRGALSDVPGIERVQIFGSEASGRASGRSDIDLLVVGRPDRDLLTERLEIAARALGRSVNEVVASPAELAERRRRGDGFLRSIDDGQVIEVVP